MVPGLGRVLYVDERHVHTCTISNKGKGGGNGYLIGVVADGDYGWGCFDIYN